MTQTQTQPPPPTVQLTDAERRAMAAAVAEAADCGRQGREFDFDEVYRRHLLLQESP